MTLTKYATFTPEVQAAVRIASAIAKEYHHAHYTPAHLLRACLHKEVGLAAPLQSMGIDIYYLEEWAEVRLDGLPKSVRVPEEPGADEQSEKVWEEADALKLGHHREDIDAWCLLVALGTPGVGFSFEQLKSFPFTRDQLLSQLGKGAAPVLKVNGAGSHSGVQGGGSTVLKYVYKLTDPARLEQYPVIVGRDAEVRVMTEILTRKGKSSILIIGEGGVGKTTMVAALARAIVQGQVPLLLQRSDIYALDYAAFIAGAAYKNELEDRLLQVIQQLKLSGKHILFLDNLHTLLDKQPSSGTGMGNIIKAALGNGEIIIIGTSTPEGFRKLVEPDSLLRHCFETITLQEADEELAARMLTAVLPAHTAYYQLAVAPEAVPEAIRLARRYLKERSLPDSAINLLDRTLAAIRAMEDTGVQTVAQLEAELTALVQQPVLEVTPLLWWYQQLMQRLSGLVTSRLVVTHDPYKTADITQLKDNLSDLLVQLRTLVGAGHGVATPVDLATMIAEMTGIPLGKIQSQERERLVSMDVHLRKRVVGQDHALKSVSEAILESRSGLSRPGQPIGSFFFLGPTGTGKTELAKSLADFLFQDESSMIRFDMSEFKEEHSAALLYGAPPGYVGYEEGGLLVNKIRQQPYAVVLFDEIEKAHPSVFDIFLQIMDEGKLHDRLGKTGDFSNALVLFTSNIASDVIAQSFRQGVIPAPQQLMEIMSRHFRPEFLGRLTEIVPFGPIQQEHVVKIFDIHLKHLLQLLQQQGMVLEVSERAREQLAIQGYSPQYGARPLKEVIRSQLRKPLSRMIIEGRLQAGMSVFLDVDDAGVLQWRLEGKAEEAADVRMAGEVSV